MLGWYSCSGSFKAILKNPKSDITVLLVTFFLTVIFDLTVAIEVGLLIACLLFMRRMSETTKVSVEKDAIDLNADSDVPYNTENLTIPDGVEVYEINGPYFFGVANRFEEVMNDVGKQPAVRIIRMRKVPFIDSTGVHNLTNLCNKCLKKNIQIVLSGVNGKVLEVLCKSGFNELIGNENICSHITIALDRAKTIVMDKEKQ